MSIDTSTTAGKARVMLAFEAGKKIEQNDFYQSGWQECTDPTWAWNVMDYRIAPEPPKKKLVPWTMETCPLLATVRIYRDGKLDRVTVVVAAFSDGCNLATGYSTYGNILSPCYQLVLPDGAEAPCGTEVTE